MADLWKRNLKNNKITDNVNKSNIFVYASTLTHIHRHRHRHTHTHKHTHARTHTNTHTHIGTVATWAWYVMWLTHFKKKCTIIYHMLKPT